MLMRVKRRLRKKRIGEFQELGFEVLADLRDGLSPNECDAFLDRSIGAVEGRQLSFGGGGAHAGTFAGFVARAGRGSASEQYRAMLAAFLESDAAVIRHEVRGRRAGTATPCSRSRSLR
jgi:uncharacterized protein YggL (DUF469 family)